MKNPEPENPINNNAPPEAQSATNAPNQPQEEEEEEDDGYSKKESSPKSHSHSHFHDDPKSAPAGADVNHPKDYPTDAPPPSHQMHAPPPPPPYQYHAGPPPPPFLPPMMMQLPHSHFQQPPPYPNHHLLPFSPYGYPMTTFPSAPAPNMPMQMRDWSTGLFDCFSDLKNCIITTIFPFVTFGQVSEIINEGQTPWWEGAISYVLVDIATMSTGTFLCAWTYRAKMRQKNLLRGNLLWDLILAFFFTRFALCQLYRQLDQLGYNVPLGWIANRDKRSHGAMQHKFQVVPPPVESGMFR